MTTPAPQWPTSKRSAPFKAPLPAPPLPSGRALAVFNGTPHKPVQAPAKPPGPTLPAAILKALGEPVPAPVKPVAAVPALPPRGRVTRPVAPLPPRRSGKAVQPAEGTPATPLPAPTTDAALPMPDGQDDGGLRATPTPRIAASAVRDAAEARVRLLRGQIRNDAEALVNTAQAVGRRIAAGETPRQEGEFSTLARVLDQHCASLYELLRLLKCY